MEKKKNRLLDYQSTLAIDIKMGVSLNKVYHYTSFSFQLFEHLADNPSKE